MRRALKLAERGLGETNPNPLVGCVLVRKGVIVGEGFHARAGSPHAEALALEAAGGKARGSTAYITLEPCAPHAAKRTPPCAPRLIAAGVRRVVFGAHDLNPEVRGKGLRQLRSAGLVVEEGPCAAAARRLSQHFNAAMRHGRPFVSLKSGMTLDGRIATASGDSRWITSTKQRQAARGLRRLFGGIVVGIETVIQDDPRLLPEPRTIRPYVRVVLDSRLRMPTHSRLVRTARRHPLILVCVSAPAGRRRELEAQGAKVIPVRGQRGRVSLPAVLRALFAQGILSLIVEGGSEVMGSFVRERLFDEIVMFRAPAILGGRGSRGVVGGDNPLSLKESVAMARARREDSATLRYGLGTSPGLEVEVYEPVKIRPGRTRHPG